MKKLLALSAILLTSTALAGFGGNGCNRDGICPENLQTKSRPANQTIASTPRVSRRGNLWDVKRATKRRRSKSRLGRSSILQREKPRYLGSKKARKTPVYKQEIKETLLQKAHRLIKARREAKKLINTQ